MIEQHLNKIIQGDCLDEMAKLPDGCIDAVICDPPYGTTACKWDTCIPFEPMWKQLKRITKKNGAIVLFGSQPFTSALVMSNPKMFRYSWIWEKEQGVNFLSAKKNPMRVHEDISVFYLDEAEVKGRSEKFVELREYFNKELEKSGLSFKEIKSILGNDMGGHYFTNGVQWTLPTLQNYEKLQKTGFFQRAYIELKNEYDLISEECKITYNPVMEKGKPYVSGLGNSGSVTGNVVKKQTKNNGSRYPRSVLKINRETGLHPTQKPVALIEYLIKTYTNEGEIVLDFTAGSGTTGVACKKLNRNFILIEKDPEYVKICEDRIKATSNTLF